MRYLSNDSNESSTYLRGEETHSESMRHPLILLGHNEDDQNPHYGHQSGDGYVEAEAFDLRRKVLAHRD